MKNEKGTRENGARNPEKLLKELIKSNKKTLEYLASR
jgi:hypothetical protein